MYLIYPSTKSSHIKLKWVNSSLYMPLYYPQCDGKWAVDHKLHGEDLLWLMGGNVSACCTVGLTVHNIDGGIGWLHSALFYDIIWYTGCTKKFYPPKVFLIIFPKRLKIFKQNFTRLLSFQMYANLQNFIQLSPTLTKLCRIKCDHPPNFYISQQVYHEF